MSAYRDAPPDSDRALLREVWSVLHHMPRGTNESMQSCWARRGSVARNIMRFDEEFAAEFDDDERTVDQG